MGHRPRGLQRRRRRLGLLQPRPGALAGLSLGRGRPRRVLRRSPAPLLRHLPVWNGADPILKERVFGLTNREGNHGEDVKEYYFYLDSTPTHSYLRYRYNYPQAAYPYDDLVATNARRGRHDLEYELLDTGVFDGDRYFDVDVEYAKAAPGRHLHPDHASRIAARRRRRSSCCRPSGSATPGRGAAMCSTEPCAAARRGDATIVADASRRWALARSSAEDPDRAALHRERDEPRTAGRGPQPVAVCQGRLPRLPRPRPPRRRQPGADRAPRPPRGYRLDVRARDGAFVRLRLADARPPVDARHAADVDAIIERRRSEADEFYASVIRPASLDG